MTKPRITAAMLRKRPAVPAQPQEREAAESAPQPDATPWDPSESLVNNPSFRAPQFGIRPRVPAAAITVQRAGRRRPGPEQD